MNNEWDLIVVGGGTSGFASAISAAKNNCKVLIIEKNTYLGGSATGALVTPMMKNISPYGENLTKGIVNEVLNKLLKTEDSAVFKDGNPGWFNPEMLKCVLDDICEENKVDVLFDTVVIGAEVDNKDIMTVKCWNKQGISEFKAKYYIDASGDADLAAFAGVPFESKEHQSLSLRFVMANINLDSFAQWLLDIDPDSSVTSVDYNKIDSILLSTAYTWDNLGWKLKPYFALAVKEGVLEEADTAYFQVFSIPGQKNALAFNCPRISAEKELDPLNQEDISYAYKQGRKQIRRIAEFCKRYLNGFEESYISQIAPMLGIRDSRRVNGLYKLTEDDILSGKKFENAVAKSNYPIDIHAKEKGENKLIHINQEDYYEIPLESMIPENINNLLVVGRAISTTFKAQASIRIQPNCWSMGEYAGKYAANKINSK